MNLKNTKVYSLDEEVIRKYAELCEIPLKMDHKNYHGAIGYCNYSTGYVECFTRDSKVDMSTIRMVTITPEEINVLYAERFWQTETPEEKEAFEVIEREANHSSSVEWDGKGLPPIGTVCKVNRDSFTYRVMYSSKHVVIVQNTANDGTSAEDLDIVLQLHKGNYEFAPLETEAERQERERLESAYDLFCCVTGNSNSYNFEDFYNDHHSDMWLKIVDKTGYKKEK